MTTDVYGREHEAATGRYVRQRHAMQEFELEDPFTPVDDTPAGWASFNAQYSAEYPPTPQTLVQHVAFWRGVDIPDSLCAKVVKVRDRAIYEEVYPSVVREVMRVTEPAALASNGYAKEDARRVGDYVVQDEIDRIRKEEGRFLPVPRAELRDLIRAAAVVHYGKQLPDAEDREYVQNGLMVRVGGRVVTAAEAYAMHECELWFERVSGDAG